MNQNPLKVTILSFSYKNPPPWGSYPHGGGFVFDCRALPNPGREERYKTATGLDPSVQEYLRAMPEFDPFFSATAQLVEQAVAHHQKRGFDRLLVSYGCTGGQHRSVFCALSLADKLRPAVSIELFHCEAARWPS